MKKFIFLVLALLLMSVTSAVAQDVRYNFAKDVDFSKFKTYKWVDIKGADHANQLVQKQITDALEAELAAASQPSWSFRQWLERISEFVGRRRPAPTSP